ncbi:MAG: sulfatase-like hydrolase/transferase [Oscillospiraceae bacterium]|nr:sulfatase-like hydrolase/transferase [Oscillospiraceae bacterium]
MSCCDNKKKLNLLFFGIDSLRRDHMSLYGYKRQTTPNISKFLSDGIVFENCFSPSVPTTPGYSSMMTGLDIFSTDVVALRHQGDMAPGARTLAEILGERGYNTTCVGFEGNVGGRGYQKYLNFDGWGPDREDGRSHKAENLNDVTLPELGRLGKIYKDEDKPFFLFLRHMDPHAPYLPPHPFSRMFYQGDEFDPDNKSLEKCYAFKPFCDFHASWFPAGCTDAEYVIAQYDAEIAYMDACIQQILEKLAELGIEEETLVVFTSDHGETLNDHDCHYDHHGIYDPTLVVPFALKLKGCCKGARYKDYCQLKDVTPTVLSVMGIDDTGIAFDGRDMTEVVKGKAAQEPEMYITEATWMRKHGWRTPEWKLIVALEPDFHFKPGVELYNLVKDPEENCNVAEQEPEVVKYLTERMNAFIAKREAKTGRQDPVVSNATKWNGFGKAFESSEEAYNSMHIGDIGIAQKLQALAKEKQGK